jgi:hypothetical protein
MPILGFMGDLSDYLVKNRKKEKKRKKLDKITKNCFNKA